MTTKNENFGWFVDYMREGGFTVKMRWAICYRCDGDGTHVNPNVDGNGLDPCDPDLDEDFWDDYRSGVYDVSCYECGGSGKVRELDDSDPAVAAAWDEWERDRWESESISRQERMMGA